MAIGRKQNPQPEAPIEVMDATAVASATTALDVLTQRSTEVSERFGEGLPYERSRVVNEARFFAGQSAEAMLELGKRLIQIKENEPHGEFTEILERRLGINVRAAQRMMQAAVKFLQPALMAKASAPTLLGLGKAKLLELLSEDDGDIEALADGGTVAGLDLDEITAMSSRELRDALRESKKLAAAKDKIIAKKDAKLNELDQRNELLATDEAEALKALRTAAIEAETALAQAVALVDRVLANPPTQAAELAAQQTVDYLVRRLVDATLSRGITVDLAEQVSPAWVAPITNAVNAAPARKSTKG